MQSFPTIVFHFTNRVSTSLNALSRPFDSAQDAQGFRDKPDFYFTNELTNLAVQTNR
jgi:hypothetical protein